MISSINLQSSHSKHVLTVMKNIAKTTKEKNVSVTMEISTEFPQDIKKLKTEPNISLLDINPNNQTAAYPSQHHNIIHNSQVRESA